MTITLSFEGKLYQPSPCFAAWLEAEDELGSLIALHARLRNRQWRLSEVVALAQIVLASAGCDCDYQKLGEYILRQGAETYRAALDRLLCDATGLPPERTTS